MARSSRREFLKQAGVSVAAIGSAGGSLLLAADVKPTPADDNPRAAEEALKQFGPAPEAIRIRDDAKPTSPNPLGPFYRAGAPFRGKVCPPFEPGTVLVVSGRVWGYDTKRPLPSAVLDVWQVDIQGKYSAGDGDYRNRSRLIASETGYYEFESVHPVAYEPSPGFWRSAHIHFRVNASGYKTLVTELFFEGDPKQDTDPIFNNALLRPVEKKTIHGRAYEAVAFDIILEPGAG